MQWAWRWSWLCRLLALHQDISSLHPFPFPLSLLLNFVSSLFLPGWDIAFCCQIHLHKMKLSPLLLCSLKPASGLCLDHFLILLCNAQMHLLLSLKHSVKLVTGFHKDSYQLSTNPFLSPAFAHLYTLMSLILYQSLGDSFQIHTNISTRCSSARVTHVCPLH